MPPAVSLVIPVYNGEPHIAEAIRSCLAQTYGDFELVVLDQRSTDRTVELAERFDDPRLRVAHNTDTKGVIPNWNRAIGECAGRYIKLVCADDILFPECVARQVAALEAHAGRGAVMAAAKRDVIDTDGNTIMRSRGLAGMRGYVDGGEAIRRSVRSGTNPFGEPASVLVDASAFRASLPWTDRYPFLVDLEMFLRILRRGGLAAVPESLGAFRVHAGSASTGMAKDQGTQARGLFREVRASPGSPVTRLDLAVGAARAELLRLGRAGVYRLLALRARRG